jgi:hypothetical protein
LKVNAAVAKRKNSAAKFTPENLLTDVEALELSRKVRKPGELLQEN